MTPRLAFTLLSATLLTACAFHRADDAAAAKARMVGMTREEVLACMGPAKKKSSEGSTEVWSYLSTDGRIDSNNDNVRVGGYTTSGVTTGAASKTRSYCTVNVVMVNGVVKRINYNGPTSSYWLTGDDQCGYAVANCLDPKESD